MWIITGSHDSGNTVVSPMGLVYGKPITLDPCISETAKGNLIKFGTGDYVLGKFMWAKFHKNRSVGFFPAHTFILRWHFFLGGGSSIRLQPKPLNRFSRIIRQKNRFGPRKCLSGVKNFSKNFLDPKRGQKPPFPCISMGNENADNFWSGRPIFTKFGI